MIFVQHLKKHLCDSGFVDFVAVGRLLCWMVVVVVVEHHYLLVHLHHFLFEIKTNTNTNTKTHERRTHRVNS